MKLTKEESVRYDYMLADDFEGSEFEFWPLHHKLIDDKGGV